MKRRLITIILTLSMILTLMPAMSFAADAELPSADDLSVCYTPSSDYKGGDCILTSCKTMMRRFAVAHGSMMWTTITNKSIRPYAAPGGLLKNSFTYSNDGIKYTIKCGSLKGKSAKSKAKAIKELLAKHKEGIVVWGGKATKSGGPHGVLAVNVKGNTVYAIDAAYNKGAQRKGTLKWSSTIMGSLKKCTKYWYLAEAKGSSTSASKGNVKSTLCISAVTAPSSLDKGKGFYIYGDIDSNYLIKSVTVEIIDAAGKAVISQSEKPDSWYYDIHSLDAKVKFGKLEAGNYIYRITASDEKETKVLHESSFKVKAAKKETKAPATTVAAAVAPPVTTVKETAQTTGSSLKIKGASEPDTIYLGSGFGVKGKISSGKIINTVTVTILDKDGNEVISQSAAPGKKSYNLTGLDSSVKFGTLGLGTYTYIVSATDEAGTVDLVEKSFRVVRVSTLRIKSYTCPETLEEGASFTVAGTVKSNQKIKKVWVTIRDAKGKVAISVSAKPKAKKYNLGKLDSKIKFGKLQAGEYTYKITAKDAKQKLVLVNKTFTINPVE